MSYCFCVKGAFLSTPKTGSAVHTLQLCDNESQVILKTTISLTFCSLSTFYNNTNDGETKAKKICLVPSEQHTKTTGENTEWKEIAVP
mmetsp:Transcript_27604/g.41344  ORF Transcript_27604/g.41344 Transcript_27604/m.41344 type:complete len:88 (-) Transcript_27604:367-630(-)